MPRLFRHLKACVFFLIGSSLKNMFLYELRSDILNSSAFILHLKLPWATKSVKMNPYTIRNPNVIFPNKISNIICNHIQHKYTNLVTSIQYSIIHWYENSFKKMTFICCGAYFVFQMAIYRCTKPVLMDTLPCLPYVPARC